MVVPFRAHPYSVCKLSADRSKVHTEETAKFRPELPLFDLKVKFPEIPRRPLRRPASISARSTS